VKRAGLDYRDMARVQEHPDLDGCLQALGRPRLYALSSKATTPYTSGRFQTGDAFLMGPETRGLPAQILEQIPFDRRLRIPMLPDNRSLNLSNAAAVVIYEAWRQQGFAGGV